MKVISAIIYIIFAGVLGGFLSGFDRKISARMQGRKGPPILQPFYDVFKLFMKEQIIVNDVQSFFVFGYFCLLFLKALCFFVAGVWF